MFKNKIIFFIACAIHLRAVYGDMSGLNDINNPYITMYQQISWIDVVSLYDRTDKLYNDLTRARQREQSDANKLLSAAAIGLTSVGATNLMSALAEQKASQDAQEDMKAYLATFVCDFGQGRNIKGGDTGIQLPVTTDIIEYAREYKALATDLNARKQVLGISPGIESEPVIDIAATNLYDNVGMNRIGGVYTSLSDALTNVTSKDAEELMKQNTNDTSKINTAITTITIGTTGGAIGNIISTKKNNMTN